MSFLKNCYLSFVNNEFHIFNGNWICNLLHIVQTSCMFQKPYLLSQVEQGVIAKVIYFKKELVFSAFDFKSCFMRLEGVNLVTLCVFYDLFYPQTWLSGYQSGLYYTVLSHWFMQRWLLLLQDFSWTNFRPIVFATENHKCLQCITVCARFREHILLRCLSSNYAIYSILYDFNILLYGYFFLSKIYKIVCVNTCAYFS